MGQHHLAVVNNVNDDTDQPTTINRLYGAKWFIVCVRQNGRFLGVAKSAETSLSVKCLPALVSRVSLPLGETSTASLADPDPIVWTTRALPEVGWLPIGSRRARRMRARLVMA